MKTRLGDLGLLSLLTILLAFGLMMIADVSLVEGVVTFGDQFYFLKRQLTWIGLGLILMLVSSFIDYHFWRHWARPIFLLGLSSLVLVFIPGFQISAYGAARWLNLGLINFQPVELAKLASIFYFARLTSQKERPPLWRQLFLLLFLAGLILLEPDFSSTVLLVAVVGVIWFVGGEKILILAGLGLTALILGLGLIFSSPYRRERVKGLFDPFYDPQNKSYHVYQLVLTLGSGGWLGTGLGNSRQKYRYLPEATTDSIVALIAEELGFLGVSIFILVFLALVMRAFWIATHAPDQFGQLLALGIASLIAFQGIINLGAIAVLFPLTGMPFPFVSYGGSSLITLLFAVGILINIARKSRR